MFLKKYKPYDQAVYVWTCTVRTGHTDRWIQRLCKAFSPCFFTLLYASAGQQDDRRALHESLILLVTPILTYVRLSRREDTVIIVVVVLVDTCWVWHEIQEWRRPFKFCIHAQQQDLLGIRAIWWSESWMSCWIGNISVCISTHYYVV
jgi:hypothetical protein